MINIWNWIKDVGSIAGLFAFIGFLWQHWYTKCRRLIITHAIEYGDTPVIVKGKKLADFPNKEKTCLLVNLRIFNPNEVDIVLTRLILELGVGSSDVYKPDQTMRYYLGGESETWITHERDRYFSPDIKIPAKDTKIFVSMFLIRDEEKIKERKFRYKIIVIDANNKLHKTKFKMIIS